MVVRGGAVARVAALVGVVLLGAPLTAPSGATAAPPAGSGTTPAATTAKGARTGATDQSAAALPTAVTASSLAARITTLTGEVNRLQSRAAELDRQLTLASARAEQLSGTATEETRVASTLLAAARRQAVAAYVGSDPAKSSFALISAVGQDDVNDATWSIGLMRSSSQRTLKLAREARSRSTFADATLTDALAERDRLADERVRLDASIADAKAVVVGAESDLEAYVKRLGPGTITGMTTVAYDAYKHAEAAVKAERPACGLRWELLAAIGKTESNHGMGRLDSTGLTTPPILGIPIGADTDKGVIDTDPTVDHAVGPMQFIPSTWKKWGADGNGDGLVDINNIYDEALAAGRYLCESAGADTLATRDGVIKAIWAYNPNEDYLRTVGGRYEALASDVAAGWFSSADLPTPTGPGTVRPVGGTGDGTGDQPAANVRLVRPFGPSALIAPAVAPDPRPGVCGPTAALAGRPGVVRCDLPALGTEPAVALDPCVVAGFDPQLVACLTDPDQPVRLVRTATPVSGALADGVPFFGLVLEGGDRCLAAGVLAAPGGAPGKSVRAAAVTTTTTVAGGTTSTTRAPTSTTAAATTTTARPATTTAAPATSTTAPAATTTTTGVVTPGDTLPPLPPIAAGATMRYRCASGAEVIGNPVPGTVAALLAPAVPGAAAPTTTVARATTTVPTGTTVVGGVIQPPSVPWVAQVSQPGIATRPVAVITLFG